MTAPSEARFLPGSVAARWTFAALVAPFMALIWAIGVIAARYFAHWDRGVFAWLAPYPLPKIIPMAVYSAAFFVVFAAALAVVISFRHPRPFDRYLPPVAPLLFSSAAVSAVLLSVLSGLLLRDKHFHVGEAADVAAVAVLGVPWLHGVAVRYRNRHISVAWGWAVLAFAVLPMVLALGVTPFHIGNEFLSLSEQTDLTGGRHVDNVRFINRTHLEGLQIPDPRNPALKPGGDTVAIKAGNAAAARIAWGLVKGAQQNYWYNPNTNDLTIFGGIGLADYFLLKTAVISKDMDKLQDIMISGIRRKIAGDSRFYNSTEKEFLRLNSIELGRQLVLGKFFYAQYYLFPQAVAQLGSGRVHHWSQYGRGLTDSIAALFRMVPERSWFNTYLKFIYAGYPIYLLYALGMAMLIGIRRWELVFVGAVIVGTYLIPSLETIRLGDDLSPWRHGFDFLALFLLYRTIARPRWWAMAALAVLIPAACFWSRETGLFLGVAMAFGLAAAAPLASPRRNVRYAWGGAAVMAAGLAAYGYHMGNPHAQTVFLAFLYGVDTPQTPWGMVPGLAALFAAVMAGWWLLRPRPADDGARRADWVVAGAAIVYSACGATYFIWFPMPHHLALMAPTVGVPLVLMFKRIPGTWPDKKAVATIAVVYALTGCALLGVQRLRQFHGEIRLFNTHKVYDWRMPAGHLRTTAAPQLVSRTVKQIVRYNPGIRVNILSPWEVLVVPLAGKAKAGPFVTTEDSLLTTNDQEKLIKFLLSSKNKILFVDSRIMNGIYETPMAPWAQLQQYVKPDNDRVAAAAGLRFVYNAVAPCYALVNRGPLLSVYRRKAGVGPGASCVRMEWIHPATGGGIRIAGSKPTGH